MTSVSVVVPCLNEAGHLEALLDALRRQEHPPDEIVVADAGSTDGSIDALEAYQRRHPDLPLRIIHADSPVIPAVVNEAIRAATGEIIVRLDGHSRPEPEYIRKLVDGLERAGDGITGGTWHIVPGRPSLVARAIARSVAHPLGAGDAAYRIAGRGAGRLHVDTVPFGCFRRETWERLGGYDERLQTNEDYEFNYRARQAGLPVILDASVGCAYVARPTFGSLAAQYFRYGWWKAQMLRANPESLRLRQAVPPVFVAAVLALGAAAPFSTAAAVLWVSLLGTYGLALSAAAAHLALRCRDLRLMPAITAAFAVVHGSWGGGVLVNLITAGHWPSWSAARRAASAAPARGMTLSGLLLALTAILLLTVVIPPATATWVHQRRIAHARGTVERLARALAECPELLSGRAVLMGPGTRPESSGLRSLATSGVRESLCGVALEVDPWGNSYLVGVEPEGSRWILSAGPNGIVETPAGPEATPAGDDIGARLPAPS